MTNPPLEGTPTRGSHLAFEKVGDEIVALDYSEKRVYRIPISEVAEPLSQNDGGSSSGQGKSYALSRRALLAGMVTTGAAVTVAGLPVTAAASSSQAAPYVPLNDRTLTQGTATFSDDITRFAVIA